MQPISNNIGVALCTRCNYAEKDNGISPIDYQCQAKGLHNCINGYCTSCYKTHLPYSGGCYSRHTATGFAVCAEANQYELDNVTVCTECADTSHAPRNGACTLVSASGSLFSDCTKDADRGLCTGCSSAGKSFLFYGGCYDRSSHIGSRLCSEVAGGACKQWRSSFDFTFSKAGGTDRYLCGDANNGVHGCATCRYGNGVECTRCSAGYLGVDGRSCGKDCSGSTQGACSEVVEESSSVKVLSCRCVCKPTFYNNSGTCASCTDSCAVCKDGTSTGCQQCSPGKILNFSIASSESADCVNQCVAGSECAGCGLTIDGSRYCTRCKDSSTYPFNGVCVPDAQEDAYCAIYENGVCTACSEAAFLMSGGATQQHTIQATPSAMQRRVASARHPGGPADVRRGVWGQGSSDQGVCVCEIGTVLMRGVCASTRDAAKKKTAAIAAGATAGILVVGALAGFLCWWFICRRKRASFSSSCTTLIPPSKPM
ncbi:Hypothetical protein GLP15_4870 [Giardia lamblia P15]|uniref:Variant-specific surface protein n=1 Tax=Giardia intestinalis (strain P15) TaxID=658858 RepID=E1F9R4_GIAIA|nr:Hypothetical protein GLP15_4870 [Giardia lamblia P15]